LIPIHSRMKCLSSRTRSLLWLSKRSSRSLAIFRFLSVVVVNFQLTITKSFTGLEYSVALEIAFRIELEVMLKLATSTEEVGFCLAFPDSLLHVYLPGLFMSW
jgi:hypothetical protein